MPDYVPSYRPALAFDPDSQPALFQGVLVKRAFAGVIDTVITAIFAALALPFTAFLGIFFFPLMMLVTGFFYRWFTLASQSSTWGMRLVAIELRAADGARFGSDTAFWHSLGFLISIAITPLHFVSMLLMVISSRRQGLTDHLMGTMPINKLLH